MGWAENKVEEYHHGKPAGWLERRMLEHANPVNFAVALITTVGLVYGVWMHDWIWIIGSAVVALLGHIYCWIWRKNEEAGKSADHCAAGGFFPRRQ
jgi:hypothetical protein